MHKVVGIIAPSGDELAPIEKSMGAVVRTCRAGLEFLSGMLNGVKCVAVLSGVCKVNAAIAAQVLIDIYAVDAIIVCGVAGGMDRRLKIGDTAVTTEIAYHDVDDAILRDYHPFMKVPRFYADEHMVLLMREAVDAHEFEQPVYFGVVVTGEAFIETNGRAEINDRFKPLCVDMETAAAAHVCYVNKKPFAAIRSISDVEDNTGMATFEQNCAMAAERSTSVLKALLKRMSRENGI